MRFCVLTQKTAYEVRISDWSSDVCSSDLEVTALSSGSAAPRAEFLFPMRGWKVAGLLGELRHSGVLVPHGGLEGRDRRRQIQDSGVLVPHEIGRASCREGVCQYV